MFNGINVVIISTTSHIIICAIINEIISVNITTSRKKIMKQLKHYLTTLALGALVLGLMASMPAKAETNPFESQTVVTSSEFDAEKEKSKCGEGKCGEGKEKHKCGEGKCGEGKKSKCGEGKCGEGKKSKCGEGKCGEGKKKSKCGEGKCGEGKKKSKCGEGKCGEGK